MEIMLKYMKTCKGCNTKKPVNAFGKNKSSNDGLQSRCKICFKNYKQKPRLINSKKLDGVIPKPKFNRDQLLKQINNLKLREHDHINISNLDYSFLITNEKFIE